MHADWHPREDEESLCALCDHRAWHKVEEAREEAVIPSATFALGGRRHPLTNYLCCDCFGSLMGPVAIAWCGEFWECVRADLELRGLR